MKTTGTFAVAAAILLQSQQTQAGPVNHLVARARLNAADIAGIILPLLGINNIFKKEVEVAWDFKKHGRLCAVYMETKDGGNCKATVECDDGLKEYNVGGAGWNVCYVGGRQFFTDPRIGEFSITFTEKDNAVQGQGLTTPILQVKAIRDWAEIPVDEFARDYNKYKRCDADGGLGGSPTRKCGEGPYLCHHGNTGNTPIQDSRTKKWECGIPKIGKGVGPLDSNGPTNNKGYRPGQCGVHVVQYQKPNPAKDQYSLEVTALVDDNETTIGTFAKGGPTASVRSLLPLTLEIKTGGIDADPVRFAYGAQSWDSNSAQCSVGKYDSGNRDMDCTFACA